MKNKITIYRGKLPSPNETTHTNSINKLTQVRLVFLMNYRIDELKYTRTKKYRPVSLVTNSIILFPRETLRKRLKRVILREKFNCCLLTRMFLLPEEYLH